MTETEAVLLDLLDSRADGATLCPSEVARRLAPEDWRPRMGDVHSTVDRLLARRAIALSWKGKPLASREGPYRIGRPQA